MNAVLSAHLTAFLNPNCVDDAALRAIVAAVPRAHRRRFRTEARQRLDALERTFRPLSEFDGATFAGPEYPTVRFTSEEQLYQRVQAMEITRSKRRLLDELVPLQ
jgi:hypothetical protein